MSARANVHAGAARAWPLLLSAFLTLGCHSERWTADAGDYAAYRRARLSSGGPERLNATWQYLQAYPKGTWRREMMRAFTEQEQARLAQIWDQLPLLRRHAVELPNSPQSRFVRRRIRELVVAEHDSREHTRKQRALVSRSLQDRNAFLQELKTELSRLNALELGQPKDELSELSGLNCTDASCSWSNAHRFLAPKDGRIRYVELTTTGELRLVRNKLSAWQFGSPALFEAVHLASDASGSKPDPDTLITSAQRVIGSALSPLMVSCGEPNRTMTAVLGIPATADGTEANSTLSAVHWQCAGFRLELRLGSEGQNDTVTLSP